MEKNIKKKFRENGPYIRHHKNGQLSVEANVYNNMLNGTVTQYSQNGFKTWESIYLNNKRIADVIGGFIVMI